MSKRNGDKARFNRRRKKKLLNRKRNRELWKALESEAEARRGPDFQLRSLHRKDLKTLSIDQYKSSKG